MIDKCGLLGGIHESECKTIKMKSNEKDKKMCLLRKGVYLQQRFAEVLLRTMCRGGKGSAQEEATGLFEGCPASYRHRQPGVSHILQGCHPHGMLPSIRLQIGKRGETSCITNQQPDGIRPQGRHREDACWQSLS